MAISITLFLHTSRTSFSNFIPTTEPLLGLEPIGVVVNCVISLASPFNLRNRLREVDVDATVVDQHVVHLEVRVFARLLLLELDERVLQGVARHFVADHLARLDLAEAAEDDLQVVVGGDGIQLAHE